MIPTSRLYHGNGACGGWFGSPMGGGAVQGWAQDFWPAESLMPLLQPAFAGGPAVFAPPVSILWDSANAAHAQGGWALQYGDPNAVGGPWGEGAGRVWMTPYNLHTTVNPYFQAVFAVSQAGAVGNRTLDWQCYYFPYASQELPAVTTVNWGVLTYPIAIPPVVNSDKRIYLTDEVQLAPSDPDNALAPNTAWCFGIHRRAGGDNYTGLGYLLGVRVRYLVS